MDEVEIKNKAKLLKLPFFFGTFPIDELPNKKFPYSFILNHDPHNKPGSHWVAVIVHSNKNVEYFDSLGQKPPSLLYQWKRKINYNKRAIQNIFANTCGHHSLYYLYLRTRLKITPSNTIKYLLSLKNPDTYVKNFIVSVK